MTDSVVVLCTCGTNEEAERIAAALIDGHVAACVNILPPVRSLYRWQGKVESAEEILLLIKTTQPRFEELRCRILQLHSYETPEIIALPIAEGLEKYMTWLRGQV